MEDSLESPSLKVKVVIALLALIEAEVITMLYPLLPFMVEHFLEPGSSEQQISEGSGNLEGIYRLMQFFGCIWVGMLSDKIGRCKVLAFTTFINFLSTAHLAFCTRYSEAYVNRLLSGLCAGSTTMTKSLIRELSSDSNISQLYGFFAIGFGFASFLGPLLAMTANPNKWLSVESSFFKTYPYSMPLLLQYFLYSSFVCLLTFLSVVFFLKEPNRPIQTKNESAWGLFRNKLYLLTVLCFWMVGFFQSGFLLVYSLISKSPVEVGGIGIQMEYQVSFIQMVSGVLVFILPPLLTPRLNKRFGLIISTVALTLIMMPVVVVLGMAPWMSYYFKYAALFVIYGLESSIISIFISYISICISNTVTSQVLATAIGLSQALLGISRFTATSAFGVVYGWTVGPGLEFGFDARSTCFFMGIVPVFTAGILWFAVDRSVERKKEVKSNEIPLVVKNERNLKGLED